MQDLAAAPRDQIAGSRAEIEAIVKRLLTGDAPHLQGGVRLLDRNDNFIEDITDYLHSGTVTRDNYAKIPGTLSVNIDREIRWGVERLQPYVVLSDYTVGPYEALFYLGVFVTPTVPKVNYAKIPRIYTCKGYDKTYTLDRLVGDTWVAPNAAEYLSEVRRVLTAAGETNILLDGTAAGKTLPKARVWPLIAPTGADRPKERTDNATFLQIANDLLGAIGYQKIWYDELGRARSGPFVAPQDRTSEFTFNADTDDRIVGEQVEVTTDRFKAPNAWKFIRRNMPDGQTPALNNGIYEYVNQSDGETSVDELGYRNWKVEFVDAESQSALVSLGQRTIDADRRVNTLISMNTGPFPALGHMDVFTYADLRHSATPTRVLARSYRIDVGSGDTSHQWEEIA